MPKPIYTLISESGAQDKETGRVSHFNVLEQIHISRSQPTDPQGHALMPMLSVLGCSCWGRQSGEEDQDFEYELSIRVPGKDEPLTASAGSFRFTALYHRFMLNMAVHPFQATGEFRFVCRVRPEGAGEDAWLSQDYSVPVMEAERSPDEPTPQG